MEDLFEIIGIDASLLHSVTMTKSHGVIFESLVIHCDTVRCADCILTAITLADRVFLIVVASEVEAETMLDFASLLVKKDGLPEKAREIQHRLDGRRCRGPDPHSRSRTR